MLSRYIIDCYIVLIDLKSEYEEQTTLLLALQEQYDILEKQYNEVKENSVNKGGQRIADKWKLAVKVAKLAENNQELNTLKSNSFLK